MFPQVRKVRTSTSTVSATKMMARKEQLMAETT